MSKIDRIGPNKWFIKISIRVDYKDEPVKKQLTFTGTKTEAELKKADLIKQIRNKGCAFSSLTIRTLSDALEIYIAKKRLTNSSHLSIYKSFKTTLGHLPLEQVPEMFEQYLKNLKCSYSKFGTLYKEGTVNQYIDKMVTLFNFLVDMKHIKENPITPVLFPRYKTEPRDRYYSIEEREKIISAIKTYRPYLLAFVQYSIAVPCRKMELVTAKREQYNQFTNTIYIPDSKADIPITKPVPPEMKDYFKNIPIDCPYLFYRKDKKGAYHPLGNFFKAWKYCLKKAGVEGTIHDFRHVSSTDLYNQGMPERMIMDIAGWKTPMLSTYRHKDSLKSAQLVNDYFRTGIFNLNSISISN